LAAIIQFLNHENMLMSLKLHHKTHLISTTKTFLFFCFWKCFRENYTKICTISRGRRI